MKLNMRNLMKTTAIAALLLAPGAALAAPLYTIIEIPDLPGGEDQSFAFGINDGGQVVGNSLGDANGDRAFVWNNVDGIMNLNNLLDDPAGWILTSATDINASGQIVGFGFRNGVQRGFLLNPVTAVTPPSSSDVPEPMTLSLLGAGLFGVALARRRK